jgi:hypothetical protein
MGRKTRTYDLSKGVLPDPKTPAEIRERIALLEDKLDSQIDHAILAQIAVLKKRLREFFRKSGTPD